MKVLDCGLKLQDTVISICSKGDKSQALTKHSTLVGDTPGIQ